MGTCGTGRVPLKHPGAPGRRLPRPQPLGDAPLRAGRALDPAGRPASAARGGRSGARLPRSASASAGGQSGSRRTGVPAPRAGRGARPGEGGFGCGARSFCGNVPGAGLETKRARSSRARASRDGKSRGRKRLRPGRALCPTPFSAHPRRTGAQDVVCAMVIRVPSGGRSRPVATRTWTARGSAWRGRARVQEA